MLAFYVGNNFSTVQDFKHKKYTDEENTARYLHKFTQLKYWVHQLWIKKSTGFVYSCAQVVALRQRLFKNSSGKSQRFYVLELRHYYGFDFKTFVERAPLSTL